MKKLLLLGLIILLSSCETTNNNFDIVNCKTNDNIGGICVDLTKPIFSGVDDITIENGEDFDPLYGVSAIDDLDGDITENIIVEEQVNTDEQGTYLIKYIVEDNSGNKSIVLRYLTVERPFGELGVNLVYNGEFNENHNGWNIYETITGGDITMFVDNETLVIEIETTEESVRWDPRIDFQGLNYEQGATYQVSFDIKAERNRVISIMIGELINQAPWFYHFRDGEKTLFDITTQTETITFEFTMYNETTYNGAILFEFGRISGEDLDTTITLDNVIVRKIN